MTHYEVFRECFPELKLTEEHYDLSLIHISEPTRRS